MQGAFSHRDDRLGFVNVPPFFDPPVCLADHRINVTCQMGTGKSKLFLPRERDADGKHGHIAAALGQIINQFGKRAVHELNSDPQVLAQLVCQINIDATQRQSLGVAVSNAVIVGPDADSNRFDGLDLGKTVGRLVLRGDKQRHKRQHAQRQPVSELHGLTSREKRRTIVFLNGNPRLSVG